MNDDQLIRRLEKLKGIGPTDEALSSLKHRVFLSVEKSDPPSVLGTPGFAQSMRTVIFRPVAAYAVVGLFSVVLLAMQGSGLINATHSAYLQARIATTSNGYEKARLSLALAQSELAGFESDADASRIADLSSVSAETDQYMNELHLVGEPGKYSSEQCLEAYRAYEDYLDELQTAVRSAQSTASASAQLSLASLQDAANRYQQAADARLKLY